MEVAEAFGCAPFEIMACTGCSIAESAKKGITDLVLHTTRWPTSQETSPLRLVPSPKPDPLTLVPIPINETIPGVELGSILQFPRRCDESVCGGCIEQDEYDGAFEAHRPDHGEWSPCYCGCVLLDSDACLEILEIGLDGVLVCPSPAGHLP